MVGIVVIMITVIDGKQQMTYTRLKVRYIGYEFFGTLYI